MRNRIPREILQEIQARTSLVSVASSYVTLRKQGRQYAGLCPFHGEKSPSFYIDDKKGLFHCFGCQAGGDVFHFLMQIENRSFPEVVHDLAQMAGVEIPQAELTPEQERRQKLRHALQRIHEIACSYYEQVLDGELGIEAVEYLQARGLTAEVAAKYRVGFATSEWSGLLDYIRHEPRAVWAAERAGLILEGRQNRQYDRFRGRVMFPISDANGKVIAFGGRTLGDDKPKYLNSPESDLFSKSHALYGLAEARRAIGKEDAVLIVEGYFDVLMLAVHGIENVVATCGTSLTRGHLRMLRRYTRNVVLIFDGDAAGQKAAERSLELFLDEGMWPHFMTLPDGQDPDDVVRDEGREGFEKRMHGLGSISQRAGMYGVLDKKTLQSRMAAKMPLLDHLVMERCRQAVKNPNGATDVIGELVPLFQRLRPSQLSYYINLVSEHTGVSVSMIHEQMQRLMQMSQSQRASQAEEDRARRTVRLDLPREEELLVQLMVQFPEKVLTMAQAWGICEQMTHEGLRGIAEFCVKSFVDDGEVSAQTVLEQVEEGAFRRRLAGLFVKDAEISASKHELELVFLKIRQRNLGLQLKEIQEQIARLSRSSGDPIHLAELAQKRLELVRENDEIKRRLSSRAA